MRPDVLRGLGLATVIVLAGCTNGTGGGGSSAAARADASYACDDDQFVADRTAFTHGTIAGDQFVDVCGSVTRVLAARRTASGTHGYFYVALPSGGQIEIVSNLDAMAQAPSDDPPPWPWVTAGQYVYVQGRYYFDSSSRQGIDWTEDDSSRSWPHVGYVAVCASSDAGCTKYW